MNRTSQLRRRNCSFGRTSLLVVAIVGLLVWLPGPEPLAQQEPNRQLVQSGSANTNTSKRLALVIGNGAYTNAPPLRNPPNDARDMAATLRALGFDVTSGINANQRDMKRLIREFGQKLKAGGSGLFYYAGHGVQSKGRNYLIPIEADIQSEVEAEDAAVDVGLVLGYMDDAQNGLNIVILDACRNNPFARSFRSASDGLAQVDAPTGTLIAYATAPGRVASDGTGQNGLYTSELLKQMRVPGLSATEMFMRVRSEVMKQTGSKQVPWEASSLVGSFYFSGGPANSTASSSNNGGATGSKIDPSAFELSYWETIKSSQSADDFKAYLEKYPEGQFAGLAKNRIASLQPTTKPAERASPATGGQAELTFWDSIKNSTSADDYRAYLEKYPNGEFVVLAKNRLGPLEITEKEKAKADELARNTKTFVGRYGRWGAGLSYNHPGKLIVTPGKIQFVYDDVEENKSSFTNQTYKPEVFGCNALDIARVDGVFIREIREMSEGKEIGRERFQAESAEEASAALSAMKFVCANPGTNFSGSTANNPATGPSSIDPNAKTFAGYYGIMSSGFTARAGKLVISAALIQFVWNSGKDGLGELPVKVIAENPQPLQLPCSSFARARTDGDFIREISQNNDALVEITGWGGAIARFKAASAADAAAALAVVREACKSQPK